MTEHELKYEGIAQQIGVERLRNLLQTGATIVVWGKVKELSPFPPPERMAELAQADQHLNNISLLLWDARHDKVRSLLRGTGIKSWSLCDTVCVLKHVAKFHYAKAVQS